MNGFKHFLHVEEDERRFLTILFHKFQNSPKTIEAKVLLDSTDYFFTL